MANYQIKFLKSAKKEFAKLPRDIQERIAVKLDYLLENPYLPDTKKLKNGNGRLRVRVGNYRIIYRVENEELIILMIKVGHRREIYQSF